MKVKTCTLVFTTCSIFFLSLVSCSVIGDFLQCLPDNSLPSNPIQPAVYTATNPTFQSTLHFYARNKRIVESRKPNPSAIVAAAHESHVRATIICAKSHGLQIRIRSGGHDYEGLSYVSDVPYVILDMFNLRRVDINIEEELVWVETGATLGELYYNIARKSTVHAFPGGICPTVGVGGHLSGGGYGNLMRKYGLSADNIIDARLVNVNGTILNRESMGEDLFWAIRGGGGASFGVILSYKIKLVPVPPKLTVFNVTIPVPPSAMYKWQLVAPTLPSDLHVVASARVHNGTVQVKFMGQFLGHKERLLNIMTRRFPELGLNQEDCIELSWIESVLFWDEDGIPAGTPPEILLKRERSPVIYKNKSDFLKRPIPKIALEKIWNMLIGAEKMKLQFNPLGGRMSEISESETPFPHRGGNLFLLQYGLTWQESGAEAREHYLNVSRSFYAAMGEYVSESPREAFVNFRDLDLGVYPSNDTVAGGAFEYGFNYFKGNFGRLMRVKSSVDPTGFFTNEQSVPSLASLK